MNIIKAIIYQILTFLVVLGVSIIHPFLLNAQPQDYSTETKFFFVGQTQLFTVPDNVYSLDVEAAGGAGGHAFVKNNVYGEPGLGGKCRATIPVQPGQIIKIDIGQKGQNATENKNGLGGLNGGADGGWIINDYAGGGGGGASTLQFEKTDNFLLVAGGGGGAGKYGKGGNGGSLNGGNGFGEGHVALGGSQTQGGLGGIFHNVNFAQSGSRRNGGGSSVSTSGGGGGGGWYGGGGGALGDGAGGSSYANPEAKNVQHTQGANKGEGYVYIKWQPTNKIIINPSNRKAKRNLKIFPNPTSGEFTMQLDNEDAGQAELSLQLPTGATLLRKSVWLKNSFALVKYTIPGKVPGIYYVTMTTSKSSQSGKVVVK